MRVVKIDNLDKWSELGGSLVLSINGIHERKLEIVVNCSAETSFELWHGKEKGARTTFLASVKGLATLKFTSGGEMFIHADTDGQVWYYTDDGDNNSEALLDEVSITVPLGRHSQSPDLVRVMKQAEQRGRIRDAVRDREQQYLLERIEALTAAMPAHNPETGEVIEDEVDSGSTQGDTTSPATDGISGADGGSQDQDGEGKAKSPKAQPKAKKAT